MFILKYDIPVLLASSYQRNHSYQKELVKKLQPFLPNRIYCHLDRDSANDLIDQTNRIQVTPYKNMKISSIDTIHDFEIDDVQKFGKKDKEEIISFLKEVHPDYFLDEEYINQGCYFGIKRDNSLISIAGLVAKSERYSVVSIGNVATHPLYRKKNLASKTISALIQNLYPTYRTITLNVKEANVPAINCYKKLEFIETGTFEEVILE
ncbi:ribosomal protein S18 acetylase RimI-like enzyme [Bacillus pakistanensis]|uniref:Ribosomal protein S18 acetylase RimI-like enzyme n=1 Tax=Rossellomorea pakistanensis TaxID=992288 RepID=A0ABS2N704_9BACI|nr:GNAT family N-acetyltransferase [Bacillus pakistanensis]MBM7583641.1 ribosomal protein S18 acetylase RimI-like enzyme [Bacillus pakistanensis]